MTDKEEIITMIAHGKCISHKLPSYMSDNKDKKKSVAEEVLFS